uniref:Porin family protein n=1 Tax=Roseihalotalea indica TaxID=2867963 RepID=A0AA49GQG5_9BACT|nr:porin family protein [Tunicatimonas sp. TK19036]
MKKMKQICTCLTLIGFLSIPMAVQAQMDDSRFGIKAGVNLSNFYQEELGDQNLRVGFNAGIFTELAVGESFSIQPELLFTTKGNQISYGESDNLFQDIIEGDEDAFTGDVETNLTYIELPVLAKFTISEVINLHVGPYVSYLLDASSQVNGTLGDRLGELDRNGFNTWDYGVAAGIGVDLNLVTIGFRYDLGLNGITEDTVWEGLIDDRKNQALQFYVGIGL